MSQIHSLLRSPMPVSSNPIADMDWNDPISVANAARELHRKGVEAHLDFEAKTLQNMEYMAGNQFLLWNSQRRLLEPDRRMPSWYRKLVFNRILPAHKMRQAKLIRYNPSWDALPVSDDQEDHVVARRNSDVLGWYYTDNLGMPEKIRRGVSWADICGEMYFHWFWGEDAGFDVTVKLDELMRQPMPGQPPESVRQMQAQDMRTFAELFGPEAAQQGYAIRKSGDPKIELIPPLDVFEWPFDILDFKEAQKVLVVKRRSASYVARKTDRDIEEVKGIQTSSGDRDWKHSLSAAYDQGRAQQLLNNANPEIIYEYLLYCPRGVDGYDKGRASITYGNDEEASYLEDLPYQTDAPDRYCRVPVVRIQSEPIEGKYRGTCLVDQLRHTQDELNTLRSQKANYRNLKINPTIIRFSGDGMKDNEFTNRPGAIAKNCTRKELMPMVLEMPGLDAQYDKDEQELLRHFNDISGVASVDYGYAAGDNVASGKAIIALKAHLDENIQPFGVRIDEGVEELGVAVNSMLQQYHIDERDVQIIGEDNRTEVVKFSAALLRPSTYGKPGARAALIRVRSHRTMPTSREETYALVNMIVANKVFDLPTEQQALIWRMIGQDDVRQVLDQTRIDESKVQAEIAEWRQMKEVMSPIMADNDVVHLRDTRRWQKTEEYRTLVAQNPMLDMGVEYHCRLHEEQIARKALRQNYLGVTADLKEWLEAKANLDRISPGASQLFFPSPLGPAGMVIANQAMAAAGPPDGEQHGPHGQPNGQNQPKGAGAEHIVNPAPQGQPQNSAQNPQRGVDIANPA